MGSYPWGPHGPQSSPNEVTPNPTPAYVPPPSDPSPSWESGSATPSYSGAGSGAFTGGVGYAGPPLPRYKSYVWALVLAFLLGPLGLFYVSKKGGLAMLFLLVAVPVALTSLGAFPVGSPSHPFSILEHSSVMDRMWSLWVVGSMVWSVIP